MFNTTRRWLNESALAVLYRLIGVVLTLGFSVQAADYVGTDQCIDCHQAEHQQWQGSHHDMAMRHMDDDAVLGNFDNVSFEFDGKQNRFYRKGEQYWVNIEGPDGKFHDYQISYTFGFGPQVWHT